MGSDRRGPPGRLLWGRRDAMPVLLLTGTGGRAAFHRRGVHARLAPGVSKKHGHRKKRRRKKARTAPALLAAVAQALTACEAAGLKVKLSHGAVATRQGYVVPLGDGRWGARTLVWTEFSPSGGSDDD